MFRALAALTGAARGVVSLVMAGVVAVGAWLGYSAYTSRDSAWRGLLAERDRQIVQLQRENEELETRLRLLKVDDRVARIEVLDQYRPADGGPIRTKFKFIELNDEGKPLGEPKVLEVAGEKIYLDAWVVKFQDKFVEEGSPLRGKSIYLFRGAFGEHQTPSQAVTLDEPNQPPVPYRDDKELSRFERNIWSNFWSIASDPAKLQAIGARAASGEAPYMRVTKGGVYRIELRSSGGLSWVTEEVTPAIRPL